MALSDGAQTYCLSATRMCLRLESSCGRGEGAGISFYSGAICPAFFRFKLSCFWIFYFVVLLVILNNCVCVCVCVCGWKGRGEYGMFAWTDILASLKRICVRFCCCCC